MYVGRNVPCGSLASILRRAVRSCEIVGLFRLVSAMSGLRLLGSIHAFTARKLTLTNLPPSFHARPNQAVSLRVAVEQHFTWYGFSYCSIA